MLDCFRIVIHSVAKKKNNRLLCTMVFEIRDLVILITITSVVSCLSLSLARIEQLRSQMEPGVAVLNTIDP